MNLENIPEVFPKQDIHYFNIMILDKNTKKYFTEFVLTNIKIEPKLFKLMLIPSRNKLTLSEPKHLVNDIINNEELQKIYYRIHCIKDPKLLNFVKLYMWFSLNYGAYKLNYKTKEYVCGKKQVVCNSITFKYPYENIEMTISNEEISLIKDHVTTSIAIKISPRESISETIDIKIIRDLFVRNNYVVINHKKHLVNNSKQNKVEDWGGFARYGETFFEYKFKEKDLIFEENQYYKNQELIEHIKIKTRTTFCEKYKLIEREYKDLLRKKKPIITYTKKRQEVLENIENFETPSEEIEYVTRKVRK
ncbi:MAG: hypothetical protein Q4G05_01500 [Clostridia bacterium]|nr:hypothetical protein [Clostridia bacterium]